MLERRASLKIKSSNLLHRALIACWLFCCAFWTKSFSSSGYCLEKRGTAKFLQQLHVFLAMIITPFLFYNAHHPSQDTSIVQNICF